MATKTCTKCLEEHPIEEFCIRDKKTGRRHSWCVRCLRIYQAKSWRSKSSEMKIYKAKWYEKNKEDQKAKCRQRYHNGDKQKSSYIVWKNKLRREFGITEEKYYLIMEKQQGVCKICNAPDVKRLAVDHCHKTGVIRGLLCQKCNTALGLFKEDSELLQKAILYLNCPDYFSTT